MKTRIELVKKEAMFEIGALAVDGTYWILRRRFRKDCPVKMRLIERIRAAGEIDTTFWKKSR
jgi:hypothetical protein